MKSLVLAAGLVLALALPLQATPINAALGKPVTSSGPVGVITCCWPDATTYPPAPLSSIVDGVYRPESTQWQDGTVWWDERHAGSLNNMLEIDLLGTYLISFLSIQADNNDEYLIHWRDAGGVWSPYVLAVAVGGFGMTSRAGSVPPVLATAFRIDPRAGDQWYSVSEFQAIGEQVPEPAMLLLLATGLTGAYRRFRPRV